ncbi:hypothetical protein SLEP1_g3500 [Rubroshorea leprosula]|uniref:Reverse transcriptase domain-containing protein n=1 Tax=Rubroshorea leprosula TaxID=152421 RepID=A0AAV5HUC8_9ROSI|nr:hypothetical protein SLEP1_g3500 [Rubroshorea leprosula]
MRCSEVKNVKSLENELDEITIDGVKLHVNLLRFERISAGEYTGMGRGFGHTTNKVHERNIRTVGTNGGRPRTYAKALQRNSEGDQDMGRGNVRNQENQARMKKMVWKRKDLDNEWKENASDWLKQWFDEIRPWFPEMVVDERFTWIRCHEISVNGEERDDDMAKLEDVTERNDVEYGKGLEGEGSCTDNINEENRDSGNKAFINSDGIKKNTISKDKASSKVEVSSKKVSDSLVAKQDTNALKVYKEAKVIQLEANKRKKGRSKEREEEVSELPQFLPNSENKVTGDSLNDSNINNCNTSILARKSGFGTKEIWEFAKFIGAVALRNEEEVLMKLQQMEQRDQQHGETIVSKSKKKVIAREDVARRLGGLLCIWKSNVFKMEKVIEGVGFLGVFGFGGVEEVPCYIVNVYSSCQGIEKRQLREELRVLIGNSGSNWRIGGDFNVTRSKLERKGCEGVQKEMKGFEDFITNSRLIDLPLISRKFTWVQPNGTTMTRLDRFLLTEEWLLNWEGMKQWGLARRVSDHYPLLLKNEVKDWGPKPFCFFNTWLQHPNFKEWASKEWKTMNIKGWSGFVLKEKLKGMKASLKKWSKEHYIELDKKIEECKEQIDRLDKKGEIEELNIDEIELKRKWTEGWRIPKLDGVVFNKIYQAENEMLIAQFTEEEITQAVWDCDSMKALGPDGFSFGFIKEMWESMRHEVSAFVNEFHRNGQLVKGSNSSFVVLIPKKENPIKIEDYRPISLTGCIYKIIAKLLANRLIKVMKGIINNNQLAFVKGRQLIDSVIVANETIDEAKKKKRIFIFKANFEKAATKEFKISKGLRQGDPLSHFLFLIIVEGLNGIINYAVKHNLFKGVTMGKGSLMITHLQFADDTIFFREATEENMKVVKGIMRTFELASGLKINYNKSQLIGVNVKEEVNRMSYFLNCNIGELQMKYLGMMIGMSTYRVKMWKGLIDKFKKKLSVPKGVIKAIDTIRRGFLWGGREEGKKIAWVGKVVQKISDGSKGLWKNRLLKERYGKNGTNWHDWMGEGKGCTINEMGHWEGDAWRWCLNWRKRLLVREAEQVTKLMEIIQGIQRRKGVKDSWRWAHNKGGKYNVKFAYALLARDEALEGKKLLNC